MKSMGRSVRLLNRIGSFPTKPTRVRVNCSRAQMSLRYSALRIHKQSLLSLATSCSSSPSNPSVTPTLLKQCKNILQINLIHQQILVQGLITHFSTHLISSYISLHSSSHALSLLQALNPSSHAVFWWNNLIRRAVRLRHLAHTLLLYSNMCRLGWSPDHFTYPFVFKACGDIPLFWTGIALHGVVWSRGFMSNVFVSNAVVAMYGRCGELGLARKVFEEMLEREVFDLVSWNSIVGSCVQRGDSVNAIGLLRRMCNLGGLDMRPDAVSLVNVLPACGSTGLWLVGKEVHGFALRSGLSEDLFVGNCLVDMYAKWGIMSEAKKVFDGMKEKDVISWNSMVTGFSQIGRFEDALALFEKMMEENIELDVVSWSAVIAGYAQRGLGNEALDVFRKMQHGGVEPNEVTLVSVLSGCASVQSLLHGKEIHCYVLRKGILNYQRDDLLVTNALIDMYAKCKSTMVARAMFDSISLKDRNVVTWTVMIGGYAQHGEANDALELFSAMLKLERSVKPNAFTISCALMACARLAALRFGREVHAYVLRNQYDADTIFVSNCLIDMYSKSGDIDAARVVFNKMKEKNAVSWTSIMTGYGIHGRVEEALDVYDEMRTLGLVPDGVTFLVVLYACSHSGLVDEGLKIFNSMNKYGVTPGDEHYACMVDLLGRAGRLDEAMSLIRSMPMEASAIVWVALLSGCRKHANVKLGEYAAKRLSELESENDGSYTLLSNIYASARRWKDVARIRSLMKNTGIRKRPGCSWVQGKKGTSTFYVGDRTHPLSKQIYEILADFMKRIKILGYVPETSFALHDVDDEEKSDLLFEHSEKLALAYGILTTAPGAPIRITKNLRVCGDCHSAISYISMLVESEIIIRDSSRFHHFKKGSCSCRGYW